LTDSILSRKVQREPKFLVVPREPRADLEIRCTCFNNL
jgi:hypothetical protein